MFPKLYGPINKIEKMSLYNNIAEYRGTTGRLLAELRIFPFPQIEWNFEVLGGSESLFMREMQEKNKAEIKGYEFSIPDPYPYRFHGTRPSEAISGVCNEAYFGNLSTKSHGFNLYFPNLKFLETISDFEQRVLDNKPGYEFEILLDETWSVRVFTDFESLNWLRDKNIGCKLTTHVCFYQHTYDSKNINSFGGLKLFELESFLGHVKNISTLLSFANAGHVYPLFIEGTLLQDDTSQSVVTSCAAAMVSGIKPIEQIGVPWISRETDLGAYLQCLPALEKMLLKSCWCVTIDVVQIWYEKAALRSPWPIIANSIGAALERLSYTVLVEDENDAKEKGKTELLFGKDIGKAKKEWNLGKKSGQENFTVTEKRTRLLLEKIGLKSPHYKDVDDVRSFLDVRNNATHPVSTPIDPNEILRLLDLAILWVEETLLWRLGYSGEYRNRLDPHRRGMPPRYDLSLRDPTW
jgi:hypothetical protein